MVRYWTVIGSSDRLSIRVRRDTVGYGGVAVNTYPYGVTDATDQALIPAGLDRRSLRGPRGRRRPCRGRRAARGPARGDQGQLLLALQGPQRAPRRRPRAVGARDDRMA